MEKGNEMKLEKYVLKQTVIYECETRAINPKIKKN